MNENLEKTIELNKKQKEFYNSSKQSKKNIASKIWSYLRNGTLSDFRRKYDLKDRVYKEHKIWLGDLSSKKVLDLGCLRGNALSLYMAKNSKEYLGIDLSDIAISDLNEKIDNKKCANAKAVAIDFLSPEFKEDNFDVIYAYGVLHHFEDFDMLVSKMIEKLSTNGIVISYDPLETSLPIKLLRALYRPFQSDKDWEWPFKKSTLKKIDKNFVIEEKRGILGKSKYGIFFNILPLNKNYKERKIKNLINHDWNISKLKEIHKCMHVTMLFRKK